MCVFIAGIVIVRPTVAVSAPPAPPVDYLVDEDGNYILDDQGNKIKLSRD